MASSRGTFAAESRVGPWAPSMGSPEPGKISSSSAAAWGLAARDRKRSSTTCSAANHSSLVGPVNRCSSPLRAKEDASAKAGPRAAWAGEVGSTSRCTSRGSAAKAPASRGERLFGTKVPLDSLPAGLARPVHQSTASPSDWARGELAPSWSQGLRSAGSKQSPGSWPVKLVNSRSNRPLLSRAPLALVPSESWLGLDPNAPTGEPSSADRSTVKPEGLPRPSGSENGRSLLLKSCWRIPPGEPGERSHWASRSSSAPGPGPASPPE